MIFIKKILEGSVLGKRCLKIEQLEVCRGPPPRSPDRTLNGGVVHKQHRPLAKEGQRDNVGHIGLYR